MTVMKRNTSHLSQIPIQIELTQKNYKMCSWYNFLFVILLIEIPLIRKHGRECYVNDVMTTVFNYP